MLFLNVRKIKKGRKNPTEGDERMERMNVETERNRSKCYNNQNQKRGTILQVEICSAFLGICTADLFMSALLTNNTNQTLTDRRRRRGK